MIGTLQLLAACERTETLERVIVRGSAAIYGCEGAAPSFFTEDLARGAPLRTRFQRDISELEEYFDNFARRHPELTCCMLRYQPEIGADLDSPLVRYLTLPVVPVQLGFDPRLQLLHADDATGALEAAVRDPVRGAGQRRARRLDLAQPRRCGSPAARRCRIPQPLFEPGDRAARRAASAPAALLGDGVRLLRFGRGVDNTPAARGGRLRARASTPSAAVRDLAAKTAGRRHRPAACTPARSPGG